MNLVSKVDYGSHAKHTPYVYARLESTIATRLKRGRANEDTEDHVLLGSSVLNVPDDLETSIILWKPLEN